MSYVLVRHKDGAFVARDGSAASYTRDFMKARVFKTQDAAKKHKCDNESIVSTYDLFPE